jgi:hypothetical protein
MNASVPIQANGIIPVAPADVANIPPIALTIPDFEGQAILRVFANSTQSQIGCFSAVITNGGSFSHPAAIGSTLGAFALIAFASSVAVAIYGENHSETRKHYAHSLSVLVVFAVFHHIYFTGALSMNWPSVLVAWWSNFAWAAGQIYSRPMQNSINRFIGSNAGNISMVGSAPNGQNQPGLGGGFSITSIYRRALDPLQHSNSVARRASENGVVQFGWYGQPVLPGLPLPGNYSGFAGTLAPQGIPASNAFMTGFLWFLILLALLIGAMTILKWSVEAAIKLKIMRTDRTDDFRHFWGRYIGVTLLRACFIAFFMMIFLTVFQFTLGGSAGVLAIAAIGFAIFLVGLLGTAAYALYYKLRHDKFVSQTGTINLERAAAESAASDEEKATKSKSKLSMPIRRFYFTDADSDRPHVHDDLDYLTKFGWLSARYRRSKWWFFSFWLFYELVRACILGGAAGHPQVQVFALLVWEILAFIAVIWLRPFESNRLNLIMVYLLGFSKVATIALSSAFDPRFGLSRILTTVLGIVIIVIQGILTISLMVFILVGAVTSYMSIFRHREEIRPRSWNKNKDRYFKHLDYKDTDRPRPPPPPPPPEPEVPKEPYFSVKEVRREMKIEDEDTDETEVGQPQEIIEDIPLPKSPSRTMSIRSSYSNLPYGARQHRTSWTAQDFQALEQLNAARSSERMSQDYAREAAARHRASSLRGPHPMDRGTGGSSSGNATGHRRAQSLTSALIRPPPPQRSASIVPEETDIIAPAGRDSPTGTTSTHT